MPWGTLTLAAEEARRVSLQRVVHLDVLGPIAREVRVREAPALVSSAKDPSKAVEVQLTSERAVVGVAKVSRQHSRAQDVDLFAVWCDTHSGATQPATLSKRRHGHT
jgi:hypothetical protein